MAPTNETRPVTQKGSSESILHPATGAMVLVLDWLFFTSNALMAGTATPLVAVLGGVLTAGATYWLQRSRRGDSRVAAGLKALLCAGCVAVPFPIGGTLVGAYVLSKSGLEGVLRRGD